MQPNTNLADAKIAGLLPPHARLLIPTAFWIFLALWFAYDGWFNLDPEMQEHLTFNRVGTFVLVPIPIGLVYLSRRVAACVREFRSDASAQLYVSPDGDTIKVATVPWLWSWLGGGLNFIAHQRPFLGIFCFLGLLLTSGLVGFVIAFFARGLIQRRYEATGWRQL